MKAKKKVLVRIVLCSLVLRGVQFLYTKMLFPKNFRWRSHQQLEKVLQENNNRLTYLVFGDSIAQNAINPSRIDVPGFNYAFQGENILTTNEKYRYLLERDVHIDAVVLEVGFGRFNHDRVDEKLHGENLFYLYHMLGYSPAEVTRSYPMRWSAMIETIFPVLGSGRMRGYILKGAQLDMHQGRIKQKIVRDGKKAGKQLISSESLQITDMAWGAYEEFVNQVGQSESTLIVVLYPSANKPVPTGSDEKENYIQKFISMGQKHLGEDRIMLLDYYDLLDDCPECFMDGGHANMTGASRISEQLGKDLLSL